jgi:primosomal protein N' (replication factor Y)
MIQLEVAVVAPVRQSYTYSLSNGPGSNWPRLPADLIGRRVFVPFGNRRITGYILNIIDKAETEFEIKEILDILDDVPLFHADMVPLFRWISRYYHYPIGNVVKTALPAGLTISSSKRILGFVPNECCCKTNSCVEGCI